MSFPRYPEYKDSGVEWLGKVPAHWETTRLKYLGNAFNGLTYDPADVTSGNTGTLVLRSSNVQSGRITFDDNVYVDMDIPSRARTRRGDVLICSRNGSRTLIGKNAVIDEQSAGTAFGAFMAVFRSPVNPYLRWVFNSRLFEFQSGAFLTSTINQLTVSNLYSFEVPLPPATERGAISAFLEREITKIDALVAGEEKLIALLKEKRQAAISHAVTKGLNPSVPMKESEVAWLGQVPAHWTVLKIKHVTRLIEQGWSPQCESYAVESPNEWGVLKVGCVNGGVFDPTENKALPLDEVPPVRLGIRVGDLLISRANTREFVGSAAMAHCDFANLLLCDKLYRLRLDENRCSARFLSLYLSTPGARGSIEAAATGASSSMVNIGQATIMDLELAIPPLREQREIEDQIDRDLGKLAKLAAEAEHAVDLFNERRVALISAAVTGQIDVRALAKAAA